MTMQHQVYFGQYFEIETTEGTAVVTSDDIGRTVGTACEAFANYCHGEIVEPEECAECKSGWLARLTMPGYLDCTDWTAHETEQAARDYLTNTFGQ